MSTLAVLLWLLLSAQDAPLPQTPSALVGIWEGIQRFEQVGDCALAATANRVQIAISVRPDGSLRGQPAGSTNELDWTGHIGDGKVVFEAPNAAKCNQASGLRLSRYRGDFPSIKGGHRRLTLRGTDEPCPEYGCRFDKTIILTWKRPLPEAGR
jgi:hypothetical protein